MEHQFFYDAVGHPTAICPLECEAFGHWLTGDVARDLRQIDLLLNVVHKLNTQQLLHHQHNGTDYHLVFDKYEVELVSNHRPSEHTDSDIEYVEDSHASGCGLVDFEQLLHAWRVFIG